MAPFPRDGLGPRGSVRVEEAGETWPKMAPGKSNVQTNNNYLYITALPSIFWRFRPWTFWRDESFRNRPVIRGRFASAQSAPGSNDRFPLADVDFWGNQVPFWARKRTQHLGCTILGKAPNSCSSLPCRFFPLKKQSRPLMPTARTVLFCLDLVVDACRVAWCSRMGQFKSPGEI